MSKQMGLPIKADKTVFPTTTLTFLDLELDSELMEIRLPLDKLGKLKDQLNHFKFKKKATLRELQSLIGLLNFACSVVPPGTTPELSVKNVTHLLLEALPHNCIATTIGKNSRIVIWYFNQSVGHLIANQCFRNRPPNPILLASVYKFNCSDVSLLSNKKRHFPLQFSTKISQACISDLASLLRRR
jgi:hypothetical protein